jgi:SAM-dependent methyltransferase
MGAQPGTRDFFEAVIRERSTYELPWLTRIVPFRSFGQKRVLEIGCGAGYDAYEFARNGAIYTGIDIAPENIDRTRSHLALFGLAGDIREGDAEDLQLRSGSFDIVFSNGVLHHVPSIEKALSEAYRVLVPGGEIWMIVYHRNSVFYWLDLYLYRWWILGDRHRYRSFDERLSMIEYTTSAAKPLVRVYSTREVESLLRDAGFAPRRTAVRKLVREDFPGGGRKPMRLVPQALLDVFAKRFGWYVLAHGRKPSPGDP